MLVVLVIFFFLRTFRATLIPLVTIPVSLVGAFALMYAFGFTINTLTLLAMVLAIGLVVDDAIVVLENIYRHIEDGMPPVKAALLGSREIGFAVIAMTLTLAAVYAPLGFMTGRTGRLFIEFALTLAGAVMVSGFVALTLSPMMCSKLLRHQATHNRALSRQRARVAGVDRRAIAPCCAARSRIASGGAFARPRGRLRELFPLQPAEGRARADRGPRHHLRACSARPRARPRLHRRLRQAARADLSLGSRGRPRVRRAGYPTVSQGTSVVRLKPWGERERTQQEIAKSIAPRMVAVPGVLAFPSNPPSLGQSLQDKPIKFVIQTSSSYAELQKMVDAMLDKARDYPGLVDVDTDLRLNTPELDIAVDREKAAATGVEIDTVGRTLETMLGGRQVTRFKRDGEQYDVIVKVADIDRQNPDDIGAST